MHVSTFSCPAVVSECAAAGLTDDLARRDIRSIDAMRHARVAPAVTVATSQVQCQCCLSVHTGCNYEIESLWQILQHKSRTSFRATPTRFVLSCNFHLFICCRLFSISHSLKSHANFRPPTIASNLSATFHFRPPLNRWWWKRQTVRSTSFNDRLIKLNHNDVRGILRAGSWWSSWRWRWWRWWWRRQQCSGDLWRQVPGWRGPRRTWRARRNQAGKVVGNDAADLDSVLHRRDRHHRRRHHPRTGGGEFPLMGVFIVVMVGMWIPKD